MLIELIEFLQIISASLLDNEYVSAAYLFTVLVQKGQRHPEKWIWLLTKSCLIVCLKEPIDVDLQKSLVL